MSQPPAVRTIADELTNMFELAQQHVDAQLAALTSRPRAAQLRQLQATIEALLDQLDEATRNWIAGQLPLAYQLGAARAAAILGDSFTWTQPHLAAIQQLATTVWTDMLAASQFVRRDTRAWIQSEARQQATLSLIEGRTAVQAGAAFAARAAQAGIFTVIYRNGARHSITEYAYMNVRTTTARAFNQGTIEQSRLFGVEAMECADGANCGLEYHDDPNQPNGRVFPLATAEMFPIAHPNCRRSWLPRVDVKAVDAEEAPSIRSVMSIADQAASELVATGRTPRQPRTPREPRRAA